MPYGIDQLDIKPGDPVRAADLMTIANAIRSPTGIVRGGGGITVRQGPRGQVQVSASPRRAMVGLTTSTITPRTGATPGSGTVSLQAVDPSTGNLVDLGITVTVYCFSAAGTGIPSGKYGFVEQDDHRNWWLVSVEC